jgi:hypothetical protein
MWSYQVTSLWSRIWFCLFTEFVAIRRWGNCASYCSMVRVVVVFTRQQLCCPSAGTLYGQLFPQKDGAIQFWILPSVSQDQLKDSLPALLWEVGLLPHTCSLSFCASPTICWVLAAPLRGWLVTPLPLLAFGALPAFLHWEHSTESLDLCPILIVWGRFGVLPTPPTLGVRL